MPPTLAIPTPPAKRPKPAAKTRPYIAGQITSRPVPALVSPDGPIHAVLVGDCPEAEGADHTLRPWWGEAVGRVIYPLLRSLGLATWDGPDTIMGTGPEKKRPWKGAGLCTLGYMPRVTGVLLTYAYNRCPTTTGWVEREPHKDEVESPENVARLRADLTLARARGCRQVIAVGARAAQVARAQLDALKHADVVLHEVAVPSAQGLRWRAKADGRTESVETLRAEWIATVTALVTRAAGAAQAA